MARIVARNYIVGPELTDALDGCRRQAAEGRSTTVCYWNTVEESPEKVAEAYLRALDTLGKEKWDGYLSIKAPAIGFDRRWFTRVLESSGRNGIRLHFDALGPDAADETFAMIAEALPQHPDIGCTLPGRWRRSVADADWAVQQKLRVRVVKGQWPDPAKPEMDMREGFLSVIDRLAGRARYVAVASHDPWLSQEALKRLQTTKTPCGMELLYGLPIKSALEVARTAGVSVRIYIPYGYGWAPYTLSQIRQHPGIFWWVLRDLLR